MHYISLHLFIEWESQLDWAFFLSNFISVLISCFNFPVHLLKMKQLHHVIEWVNEACGQIHVRVASYLTRHSHSRLWSRTIPLKLLVLFLFYLVCLFVVVFFRLTWSSGHWLFGRRHKICFYFFYSLFCFVFVCLLEGHIYNKYSIFFLQMYNVNNIYLCSFIYVNLDTFNLFIVIVLNLNVQSLFSINSNLNQWALLFALFPSHSL